ncbi:MAG: TrkH family potassium uptake protein [Cryomorphaceae bacterium]|nr:MAG: TrkH family potassium uptake protein [Cryomorphaceae bacterium]
MTRFRWKSVLHILGVLILLNSAFLLLSTGVSWYFSDDALSAFSIALLVSVLAGGLAFGTTLRGKQEVRKREGYLIVATGWVVLSLFGSLPYFLSGAIPNYTDAFFETMSGFTTTGATILRDIEAMPPSLLFWRSCTQWIGGMGMIVLAVAILPILGVGGMQLFIAEMPGVSYDKLQPRIRETAKRLWVIYTGLTALVCVLLAMSGMGWFDGINHALTTLATGGFSTKNASIAYFNNPYVEYIITVFMFLGGTNFLLIYILLRGRVQEIMRNEEFKYYFLLAVLVSVLVTTLLVVQSGHPTADAIRQSIFQVVAIITTTGYTVLDYTAWGPIVEWTFFLLMFTGAMAGSTSGGVKLVRHIIIAKNCILELKRLIHPSAIIPVRFNTRPVSSNITHNIMAFVIIYVTIFGAGSFTMTLLGLDVTTAIGSVASAIGNVGPAFGNAGPADNYAHFPGAGKWLLSFLMMTGRLELFTVLILFTGYFWRRE